MKSTHPLFGKTSQMAMLNLLAYICHRSIVAREAARYQNISEWGPECLQIISQMFHFIEKEKMRYNEVEVVLFYFS
jgi:hypothetical protein